MTGNRLPFLVRPNNSMYLKVPDTFGDVTD